MSAAARSSVRYTVGADCSASIVSLSGYVKPGVFLSAHAFHSYPLCGTYKSKLKNSFQPLGIIALSRRGTTRVPDFSLCGMMTSASSSACPFWQVYPSLRIHGRQRRWEDPLTCALVNNVLAIYNRLVHRIQADTMVHYGRGDKNVAQLFTELRGHEYAPLGVDIMLIPPV